MRLKEKKGEKPLKAFPIFLLQFFSKGKQNCDFFWRELTFLWWHLMQKIDWIQNYALRKCGPNCLQPCVSECVCVGVGVCG